MTDVGCTRELIAEGTLVAGFVALAMAERNFTVVGIDPSENALQQARQECSKRTFVSLIIVPVIPFSPRVEVC